jgi:hypothetical protein
MARGADRASFNIAFVLNDHQREEIKRVALRGPFVRLACLAPCALDDAKNTSIRGNIEGNRALTIGVFKSLDYVNSPQSKQNVSQFEPVGVVFSTHSPCELPA